MTLRATGKLHYQNPSRSAIMEIIGCNDVTAIYACAYTHAYGVHVHYVFCCYQWRLCGSWRNATGRKLEHKTRSIRFFIHSQGMLQTHTRTESKGFL